MVSQILVEDWKLYVFERLSDSNFQNIKDYVKIIEIQDNKFVQNIFEKMSNWDYKPLNLHEYWNSIDEKDNNKENSNIEQKEDIKDKKSNIVPKFKKDFSLFE